MKKQAKSLSLSKKTLKKIDAAYRKECKKYFNTTPPPDVKGNHKPPSYSNFVEDLILKGLNSLTD